MVYHKLLSAAWLLLAAAAAVELYEEVPPADVDNDSIYQDMNAVASSPFHKRPGEDDRLQDLLMMYRLVKALLREKMQATERSANDDLQELDLPEVKSLTKRIPPSRPQQRWKTKKGRGVGPQMVCYFKLCAFRNPA